MQTAESGKMILMRIEGQPDPCQLLDSGLVSYLEAQCIGMADCGFSMVTLQADGLEAIIDCRTGNVGMEGDGDEMGLSFIITAARDDGLSVDFVIYMDRVRLAEFGVDLSRYLGLPPPPLADERLVC